MAINEADLLTLEAAIEVLDRVQDARLVSEVLMATGAMSKIIRFHSAAKDRTADKARVNGMAGAQQIGMFAGLSLAEAAIKHLSIVKRSQRATDLVRALQEGGFEMTADQPIAALSAALKRRNTNDDNLVKITNGLWCLREFLTDKERAAVEHKRRTARGMDRARSAGVQIGTRLKVTAEIAAQLKTMFEQKAGYAEMTRVTGIKRPSIYTWRKAILAWNPGEPWPPRDMKGRKEDEEQQGVEQSTSPLVSHLRAVK